MYEIYTFRMENDTKFVNITLYLILSREYFRWLTQLAPSAFQALYWMLGDSQETKRSPPSLSWLFIPCGQNDARKYNNVIGAVRKDFWVLREQGHLFHTWGWGMEGRSGSFSLEGSKLSLSAATFIYNQMLNNKCLKYFYWQSNTHI